MLFALIAVALAQGPTAPPVARSVPDEMASLYDEVCLRAFPDDAAVDSLMTRKGATALSAEDVKVTLRDDPGRGWRLIGPDGHRFTIFIEQPPFHACSVRSGMGAGPVDLAAYRRATDAFKATRPGFADARPMDVTRDGFRIRATQELHPLSPGHETLLVIAQQLTDPARIAKGENGTMLRFVHQIITPR